MRALVSFWHKAREVVRDQVVVRQVGGCAARVDPGERAHNRR